MRRQASLTDQFGGIGGKMALVAMSMLVGDMETGQSISDRCERAAR